MMTLSAHPDLEDIYPLSPAQKGILFHTLREPESAVYFEQSTRWLHGRLDVPAFEAAWQRAVDRHAILRTSFVWEGLDEPMQVVHARVPVALTRLDWSGRPERERQDQLLGLLQADRRQGFTLSRAPLMRLTLIHMGRDAFQFVWSFHHLLLDGWSAALVWREVSAVYDAIRTRKDLRLPPARPYRDYIAWLQRQEPGPAERFWRQTLQGFTAPTALLPDLVDDPASDEIEAAEQERVLPAHISAALRQTAQRQHLTLNTIVQGTWALLLSLFSGEDDVVFGITLSGRPAVFPDVEKMVGMFITTLPLRVRIRPTETVILWLQELQRQQSELMEYEHCALAHVKDWSDVPRGQPLFETILVFQNYWEDAPSWGSDGCLAVTRSFCFEKTNYPITAVVLPGEKLKLAIAYDHACFATATIDRLLRHWEFLLEQVCADPHRPLADLAWLSTSEQEELQQACRGPAAEYPADRGVHHMFAAQAARTPEAVAVQFGAMHCTYRQLDQRANQLARHLMALRVEPETTVGILLDHSLNLVAAFLGVLKAGAVHVPLDTADPPDRIRFILSDAGVRVLVTETRFCPLLPPHDATVVCLDEARRELDAEDVTAPQVQISGSSAAYVVYTSGSTGAPKGVVITHQGLLNHASSVAEAFGLSEHDRVLQFSAPAFDVAAEELYASLARGSTVVLRTREALDWLPDLGRYVEQHALTVLNLPASVWHLWVQHMAQGAGRVPATLSAVIVGSETVSSRDWALWQQLAGDRVRLWNAYGLSETTITSTLYAESGRPVATVPIGRPIANVVAYVLDRDLKPVPFGAPGELCIAGVALARGYVGRPGLTADRFVPDPFGAPGARMFRTGDRARFLADGNLQYLGRADRQVKLRGFRVDLGDIEGVLAQHPAVKDVAVVTWGDADSGNLQLVAYIVVHKSERRAVSDLRRFARTKLPHYMVPARYLLMDALPLTATMKINRQALAERVDHDMEAPDGYVAPKLPLQQLMAQIWADTLAVERVGVEDNFFDLGGHSLAAIRLVSRLREALQVRLEIRSIFENPTIAALAQEIERTLIAPLPADIPLRTIARTGCAPLAKDQEQVWVLNQRFAGTAFFNMSEILRLTGPLAIEALAGALTEITRRHEALRTTFPLVEGRPVQMVHAPAPFRLSRVERHGLSPAEEEDAVAAAASAEADRSFDLTREPPLRATLLSFRPDLNVLIFTMHHIMWDGWSLDIFARELDVLYRAFADGRPSPLEELPIQYADFAAWQKEWLDSSAKDRQLAYWQQKLYRFPTLAFPGRRDGAGSSFRYARTSMNLTRVATSRVIEASRREDITLFMMLLAALDVLIHIQTGSDDVPVAVQFANRNRVETEQVIGLFTNMLVLRVDVSGNPTFRDVLRRVRREVLEGFSNQDFPFDMLAAALLKEKQVCLEPQVMFLFDDTREPPLQLHDLSVARAHRQKKGHDVIPTTFDLIVQAEVESNCLAATFLYDRNVFSAEAVDHMAKAWRGLLEDVSSAPQRRLRELLTVPAASEATDNNGARLPRADIVGGKVG